MAPSVPTTDEESGHGQTHTYSSANQVRSTAKKKKKIIAISISYQERTLINNVYVSQPSKTVAETVMVSVGNVQGQKSHTNTINDYIRCLGWSMRPTIQHSNTGLYGGSS